ALNEALGDADACFLRVPLSWDGSYRAFRQPLDYIGQDGGAGVGSGPGMAGRAAAPPPGTRRVSVGGMGARGYPVGAAAGGTPCHYRIPLLVVVANNRSYFNDELHQERVARERGRPVENRWIGQRIADPDIDLAAIGRAQGAVGFGPIIDSGNLVRELREAI